MNFAYLSIDADDLEQAQELAADRGDTLQPWFPKDGAPDGRFDALIYGLDRWAFDPHERQQLVQSLCGRPLHCPVAVHSGYLDDEQIDRLRRHGVLVSDCLGAELLARLSDAVDTFATCGQDEEPLRAEWPLALQAVPLK